MKPEPRIERTYDYDLAPYLAAGRRARAEAFRDIGRLALREARKLFAREERPARPKVVAAE